MSNFNLEQMILQKKEREIQVLKVIYCLVDGNLNGLIGKDGVTTEVGFQGKELNDILVRLENNKLIEFDGWVESELLGIKITSQGIEKIEMMD